MKNKFHIATLILSCFATLSFAQDTGYKLTDIAGKTFDVSSFSIDEDGKIAGENIPENATIDDVLQIKSSSAKRSSESSVIVHLAAGKLFASALKYKDETASLTTSFGEIELGIESIVGLQLITNKPLNEFDERLSKQLEDQDQVFVEVDGSYQRIEGILESIDGQNIYLNFRDKTRPLSRSRVYGIIAAGISETDTKGFNAKFTLNNGSEFSGKLKSLADGKFTTNVGPLANLTFPISALSHINIRSSKFAFVSDLDPVSVEQKTMLVSLDRPWKRNASIKNNPLTLLTDGGRKEKTFTKGLGTHSGCTLKFANNNFDVFAATLGIDAETNRRGDCIFVVLGDGKELFNKRIRGTDDPKEIELEISGIEEITLQVLTGENFDLADHANWCDARMFKKEK